MKKLFMILTLALNFMLYCRLPGQGGDGRA
jgi:hypothetical protein